MDWNTAITDFLAELKDKGTNISIERFVNLYDALIEEAKKEASNLPYEQVDKNKGLFYTYTSQYIQLHVDNKKFLRVKGIALPGLAAPVKESYPTLQYDVVEYGDRGKTVKLEIDWNDRTVRLPGDFFLGWIADIKKLEDYYKSSKHHLDINSYEGLTDDWIRWMQDLNTALIAGGDIKDLLESGLDILTADIESMGTAITIKQVESDNPSNNIEVLVNGKRILTISWGGHVPEENGELQIGGWEDIDNNFGNTYINPRKGQHNLDEFYRDIFKKVKDAYKESSTYESKLLSLNPYLPTQLQTDDPEIMFEVLKQMVIASFAIRKITS